MIHGILFSFSLVIRHLWCFHLLDDKHCDSEGGKGFVQYCTIYRQSILNVSDLRFISFRAWTTIS